MRIVLFLLPLLLATPAAGGTLPGAAGGLAGALAGGVPGAGVAAVFQRHAAPIHQHALVRPLQRLHRQQRRIRITKAKINHTGPQHRLCRIAIEREIHVEGV